MTDTFTRHGRSAPPTPTTQEPGDATTPTAQEPGDATTPAIVAGLGTVGALSLCATANLIDVYGSIGPWLSAALPASASGLFVAWVGTAPVRNRWIQMLALILAQFVVGPVVVCDDTTVMRLIPTVDTLTRGWDAILGSFKLLIAMPPPLGAADDALMAVWTLSLWIAALGGMFAVMPETGCASIALIPAALGFSVAALFGTKAGYLRPAAGVGATLVAVAWIAWRRGDWHPRRWMGAALVAAIAACVAFPGCAVAQRDRLVLRDVYEPPSVLQDMTSPLSVMRSHLMHHRDDVVVTATGLASGTPLRMAVMDEFDGNVWNVSTDEGTDRARYRAAGSRIERRRHAGRGGESGDGAAHGAISRTGFTATFTMHRSLGDRWLPLAGAATDVRFEHDDDATHFRYDSTVDAGMLDDGVEAGTTYTETGTIAAAPSATRIERATAQATSAVPPDIPDSVGDLASAIAGGIRGGGAAALALEAALRDLGWFSHGLGGDYPSPPGHGSHRVDQLLSGDTAMVGDSEQYASAMALMARELGLDSRVVLGFVPKTIRDGGIRGKGIHGNGERSGGTSSDDSHRDDARSDRAYSDGMRGDGTHDDAAGQGTGSATGPSAGPATVRYTGNDIAAWVEINLQGLGWVAFYPTPSESKIPDDTTDLTPPDPRMLVRQPPAPLQDPLHDTTVPRADAAVGGEDAERRAPSFPWAAIGRVAGMVALIGSPLWMTMLAGGAMLAGKALHWRWLSRHGTPRRRLVQGWRALTLFAISCGIVIAGPRRDQARAIADALRLPDKSRILVESMGREADRAAFSDDDIGDAQARAYWSQVRGFTASVLAAMPRTQRWRVRLSPRGYRLPGHRADACRAASVTARRRASPRYHAATRHRMASRRPAPP